MGRGGTGTEDNVKSTSNGSCYGTDGGGCGGRDSGASERSCYCSRSCGGFLGDGDGGRVYYFGLGTGDEGGCRFSRQGVEEAGAGGRNDGLTAAFEEIRDNEITFM